MSRICGIVMGVAGSGKSSVGAGVAAGMDAIYFDGDDLHPPANIEKMSSGAPLNDDDRAPWLALVGAALRDAQTDTLIGCSALKRKYRDQIRAAVGGEVFFLHLAGTRAVIEDRMSAREGHFMPVSLLDSQFADLEPLEDDETGAAINIDQSLDEVVGACLRAIKG